MTMDQFIELLKEMDRRTGDENSGMFNCRPVELIPGQRYGYEFNGSVPCVLVFMPDGSIYDGQDVPLSSNPNDLINADSLHWQKFKSLDDWKEETGRLL
jgi:hypothetical protein